jgi:GNAT superfamily N-acetyltransferase
MTAKSRSVLKVREMTFDDFDALRELYFNVWGYHRPECYDRWRYLTSPIGICPVALAVDGDRLAGAYTLWPTPLSIAGEKVLGAQSIDTMTHPDYQGRGVFTTLANACYEIAAARGYLTMYGFPNPLSYPGFVRKLGWSHTGDVKHWIRPIKPSRHPKIPALLGPIADLGAAVLPTGRLDRFEIQSGTPADEDLQPLLSQWENHHSSYGVDRSLAWLRWRYSAEAENNYRWVVACRQGEPVAAGAWGIQSNTWGIAADNRAHLVELLGEDPRALSAVLAVVVREASAVGAVLLETVCNVERIEKVLRRAAFHRHRHAPFIVRSLGDADLKSDILDHDSWGLMGGDVDTF